MSGGRRYFKYKLKAMFLLNSCRKLAEFCFHSLVGSKQITGLINHTHIIKQLV